MFQEVIRFLFKEPKLEQLIDHSDRMVDREAQ